METCESCSRVVATPCGKTTEPTEPCEICEWCKEAVLMMCQQGTEVCSQLCANMAAKILFDDPERAKKFQKVKK